METKRPFYDKIFFGGVTLPFVADIRHELARAMPERECCSIAELSAIVRGSGSLNISGNGRVSIDILTPDAAIARKVVSLAKSVLKISPDIVVRRPGTGAKTRTYLLRIPAGAGCDDALERLGLKAHVFNADDGIQPSLVQGRCCRGSYLRGAFLSAGYVNDPVRGYHLEIVVDTRGYAEGIQLLLRSLGIKSGVAARKGSHVVYIKGSDAISSVLGIMGAHGALLRLESVRVDRGIKNEVNRLVNCDTGNLSRVVNASLRQVEAITLIRETSGLESLPPALREIARMRLQHPDASLRELGDMFHPRISKSGIENRLRRIMRVARGLKKGDSLPG
ncbi:MAG TPA: DNA-binding protein WhiA [Firmicutes bacterium]|nr:DNA-binding protein WhiA [Bacillota bacterium]